MQQLVHPASSSCISQPLHCIVLLYDLQFAIATVDASAPENTDPQPQPEVGWPGFNFAIKKEPLLESVRCNPLSCCTCLYAV